MHCSVHDWKEYYNSALEYLCVASAEIGYELGFDTVAHVAPQDLPSGKQLNLMTAYQ